MKDNLLNKQETDNVTITTECLHIMKELVISGKMKVSSLNEFLKGTEKIRSYIMKV